MSTVQLLVYDLSHGMAAQMSERLVGQRIEGIWHTGVAVFGLEYFYGGGVQALPLGAFSSNNNMFPVSSLDMGSTRKTQQELIDFLQSIRHRFVRFPPLCLFFIFSLYIMLCLYDNVVGDCV